MALGLPDEHSSHIKEKCLMSLGLKKLTIQDSLNKLIEFIDKHLLKDELEDAFEKCVPFEQFERSSESITNFMTGFDHKSGKIEKKCHEVTIIHLGF